MRLPLLSEWRPVAVQWANSLFGVSVKERPGRYGPAVSDLH